MSRDDEDEGWLDEVTDALTRLGLLGPEAKGPLVDAVRDLLDASDGAGPPRVQVLEGGRSGGSPHRNAEPPDLRVLHGGSDDDEPTSLRGVRVVHLGRSGSSLLGADLDDGQIQLSGEPDVHQTLLHARTSRVVRVHCEAGELQVEADGEVVVRVEEGQSADVEAVVLRVASPVPSSGRYRTLS